MRKWGIYILLLSLAVAPLGAQSNQVMDQLLGQPQARFADVVYLTLAAAKIIPDTATPEEAVQSLRQQGWKVSVLPADSPITLGDYSYLLMNAFKVKGGIFYSLFPSPRYACRELGYLKVIPSEARPLRSVPGEEAVRILGNMLALRGGTQ